MAPRAEHLAVGLLLISLSTAAAESPPAPDMELLEFLGSIETQGSTGKDVLTAIDTGLLPDLPEEPPHE
ncbi:MAG: hypothetical protein NUV75_11685 [Gallionella sp.]|nr:hypothetical protein [Gallionella sp.]